jgi:DNA-binding transcriptional LysR family regulator
MDFDRLQAFRAVARHGGFSRAAAALHKTQPAVSQAVAALERQLGEVLLLRQGRQVRLTEAGQILATSVDESFATLAAAQERIQSLRELRSGTLRLGTSDTTACYVLPPVFARFRERYPNIELRLDNHPSPVIAERVANAELDVGFVTLPLHHEKLRSERLLAREDVAICAESHALAGRRRVTLADLLHYPLLLLHTGTSTRAFIDEQLRAAKSKPRVTMEMGSVEVLKRLVELGFGVSIVPRVAIYRELEARSLVALQIFPRRVWRGLGVITRRRGPTPRVAEAFVEMARQVLTDVSPRARAFAT